jgi:hypothetical protein
MLTLCTVPSTAADSSALPPTATLLPSKSTVIGTFSMPSAPSAQATYPTPTGAGSQPQWQPDPRLHKFLVHDY